MRYTDEELFGMDSKHYEVFITTVKMTPSEYFEWCIAKLKRLVSYQVSTNIWEHPETMHLLQYRLKSIKFYEKKVRTKN